MGLKVITPPGNRALYLSDAKTHLRIKHDDDNRDILLAIDAATQWVEQYTERALINREYQLGRAEFADEMELVRPPLNSFTSLTYYDADGALQTVDSADYYVDDMSHTPRVLSNNSAWPGTDGRPNAVLLQYVAGFGTSPLDVPGDIIAALKILVGHFYENREQNVIGSVTADLKFGVETLLAPYRIINV